MLPVKTTCSNKILMMPATVEELCEEVEMVRGFCYLRDRVNAGGGCEAAVTLTNKNWLGEV